MIELSVILNNAFLAIAAIGNAIAKWCELMMTDAGQQLMKENTDSQKQLRLAYTTFTNDVSAGFNKFLSDTKSLLTTGKVPGTSK